MQRKHTILIFALLMAEIVSGFENSMVISGITRWIAIYGDARQVGWIVTCYLLVSSIASALIGRLGDIFGRKLMLVLVLLVCACGSLISAATDHLGIILIGRSLQGVAGAIIPLAFGLAKEHLPAKIVPVIVGVITAAAGISGVLGLVFGGMMTDHFGPNSMFWLSFGTAGAVTPLVAFGLPRSVLPRSARHIDWVGGLLFAPAIGLMLLTANQIGRENFLSAGNIGMLVVGAGLFAAWLTYEYRHPEPLIDVRQIFGRQNIAIYLGMACLALGIWQATQLTSMIMQQAPVTGVGFGFTATMAGALKLPILVASTLGSLWAGWASGRYGGRFPVLVAFLATAVTFLIAANAHGSFITVAVALTIAVTGQTMAFTGLSNALMANAPESKTGEVTGVMVVVRAMFQAIGAQGLAILLSTSVVSIEGRAGSYPDASAYTLAYYSIGFVALLGFVTALFITTSPKSALRRVTGSLARDDQPNRQGLAPNRSL